MRLWIFKMKIAVTHNDGYIGFCFRILIQKPEVDQDFTHRIFASHSLKTIFSCQHFGGASQHCFIQSLSHITGGCSSYDSI